MVRLYIPNLHLFRGCKVCRVHDAPVQGGSSTANLTEQFLARYVAFFYMRSGWFDWTEPSMPLFASLLGTLVHPRDQQRVAEGTVCHGRETVHGQTLR